MGNGPLLLPRLFLNSVWQCLPEFRGFLQHDAQEFLCSFLDKLDSDLKEKGFFFRVKNGQKQTVVSVFEGKMSSQVKCERCKNVSSQEQKFSFLTLDIDFKNNQTEDETVSLLDCLDNFSKPEYLGGKIYACEKCKTSENAEKRVTITELPEVLLIHTNRIKWQGAMRQKIQTKLDFPLKALDLKKHSSASNKETRYNLCGVVNHSGRHFGSGHYACYCLNTEGGGWLNFSDGLVTASEEEEVLNSQAYMLFYIRHPLMKS